MAETREMPSGIHFHSDAELAIPCPFCGSQAGELCETPSGAETNYAMYGVPYGYSIYAHSSRAEAALSEEKPRG